MSSFAVTGKAGLKLDSAQDIQPYLVDILKQKQELTSVTVSGNTLGVEACTALADALQQLPKLERADLSDIFTGRLITEIPLALKALCDSLISTHSLRLIDLSDNAFGGRSVEPMVDFLVGNTALSILKLNNNGLGPAGGSVVADALTASAANSKQKGKRTNLQTIVCGRNRLENGSAPAWAKAIRAHASSIKEVKMVQNGIRPEGFATLVTDGLRHCPSLETLDLQDNTATLRGSRAIARALPHWPKLKSLNLSDCLLRPKGAVMIMEALNKGHNPELTELKLQSNEIDDRAVRILKLALGSHLKRLSVIELNGNRVGDEDEVVIDLRSALETNGFPDALDELDDVEEADEDDEEEEELEDDEEEPVAGVADGSAEQVDLTEASIVQDDKAREEAEPLQASKDDLDDLTSALAATSLKR
ncbi:uncharacterized protein L969DRAFT_93395 [Mixia osmundae IAM 14324]|uniref:Ran-GTPase activating protein 1 C-terminal domain-containing protein n=1 Tax=Mixia osmundae (strain CBS 9802 / IAM 14324 / JCM 22182 / KY 12970) TaxID=764103 RepID=G7EAP4_MIXOS|nr:uncharacterized protein L969DRAFT_93395 [Mixia osmundae IAM 14324]KEI40873.1 hypothetical protein L969DRAFT_93395 [Mixia osmundae IAM 14324]GAA99904.1 hypothetical protein E5Q_06607 [Mixia osmundae IAM 14324]